MATDMGNIQDRARSCLSLMSDRLSQVIYSAQVNYNITGDYVHIAKMLRSLFQEFPQHIHSEKLINTFSACQSDLNQLRPLASFRVDRDYMFFDPELVSLGKNEVFLDCGAMDMSTSLEFAYNTQDSFKKIVAFDPDPVCAEVCRDNMLFFSKGKRRNVLFFDCGISDHNGTVPFERSAELGNSRIVVKSEENIPVKKIDDIPECADTTFIKVHTEGSEYNALKGAENTIIKNRPVIAVSCYHNLYELLDIPAYLKRIVPDYSLYMRHYSTGTSESVLYAIPAVR